MGNSKDKEGFALVSRPDEVTERLAVIVCTCPVTDTPGWDSVYGNKPMLCRKCNKLPRYSVRTCRECNELFAKDFKHPNWNPTYPLCWEHVQELDEELLKRMVAAVGYAGGSDQIVAPPYMARKLTAYDNYDPSKTVFSF